MSESAGRFRAENTTETTIDDGLRETSGGPATRHQLGTGMLHETTETGEATAGPEGHLHADRVLLLLIASRLDLKRLDQLPRHTIVSRNGVTVRCRRVPRDQSMGKMPNAA